MRPLTDPSETTPTAAPAPAPRPVGMARLVDRTLDGLCLLLLLSTVLVTLLQVFFRYVLNASLTWPEELARWAFVWLIFLGMAVGTRQRAHVCIDLVPASRAGAGHPAIELFRQAAVATSCIVFVVHGWDLVSQASYVSPALGLHFRYLYLAIPVGAALTLYYVVRDPIGRGAFSGIAALVLGGAAYLLLRWQGAAVVAPWPLAITLVGTGLLLMCVGVPIGFALGLSCFVAFLPRGELFFLTVSHNMATSVDSFILLAIPFFIVAGGLMNAGGITEKLVELATVLVGHLRGGLAQVNVVVNTMLAGVSGSSIADAAGTTKVLVPAMERRGYDRAFSCALTSAAAVLANLIPPSIGMILYGALASVSVGALFLAGVVPGLLTAAAMMGMVYVQSVRRGYGRDCARASWAEVARATRQAAAALLMPVVIVGGIRFGVFTATEAGAVGALYALVAGLFVYRGLGWRRLPQVVWEAVLETVAVMFVLAASAPFAWALVVEQVPQAIAREMGVLVAHPALLLVGVNVFLLLVGLPLEMAPALVILVPILLPIVTKAGIDPVHFGIVMIMNLILGSVTPPVGLLVFTTASIANAPAGRVFREVVPFLAVSLAVLALVTFVPSLSLGLPRLLGPR